MTPRATLLKDKLELWIAWRHLAKRHGERFISLITWLSVAGVALGVASLIVVFSVMTGYKHTLRDKIIGVNAHVTAYPLKGNPDPAGTVARIVAVEGVESVTPVVMGQAMLSSGEKVRGAVLRGIDPADTRLAGSMGKMLVAGSLGALSTENNAIILGQELAALLGVGVGSTVRATIPAGGTPKLSSFKVVGVFDTGMFEFDSNIAVTPIDDARRLMALGDEVSMYEVQVAELARADQYADTIGASLGPGFWVADWQRLNRNMFYALELQRVVLGLVVLVAAFNVAATLIMVVLEKTREIGILKAMGASSRSVRRVFAFEGLMIGGLGASSGAALGLGLCYMQHHFKLIKLQADIYLFDSLPVEVDPFISVAFALAAVALCYVAAVYPSKKAARLDPVEAIRIE